MRLALAGAVLTWALSGCGGGDARPPSTPATATTPAAAATSTATTTPTAATTSTARPQASIYGGPAPLLVYFKRALGPDPLASQLIVDTDGSAAALITFGGLSGEKKYLFTVAPAQLRRLRDLLTHTHLRDTWCCDTNYYVYWVTVGHRHTWRLQERRVPPSMRTLIGMLNAITDARTHF